MLSVIGWSHRCTSVDTEVPLCSLLLLFSAFWLFVTPWTAAHQAALSFGISWSFFKLMSIESGMPSNHHILCHPRLLLPSIFPSIRVFSNESALHIRWPKYWIFSFIISPSNEYSGFISFRMDWLDLLAVQETPLYVRGLSVRGLGMCGDPETHSLHMLRNDCVMT